VFQDFISCLPTFEHKAFSDPTFEHKVFSDPTFEHKAFPDYQRYYEISFSFKRAILQLEEAMMRWKPTT
jgi:hypothetical protein